MTQMNRQQFDNYTFQKIDPRPDEERASKQSTRVFWCLCVPLGALIGFFACVVGGSGGFFIPVWGLSTFGLWATFEGFQKQ
jgi:hypothetical protein